MKVRVKYCGGCNPRYDRKAEVELLRTSFPEAEFVEKDTEGCVEHVVVICGCSTACASHENLHGTFGKTVAASKEECRAIGDLLRNFPI